MGEKLKDVVALVTGAGSGIGAASAQVFAEEGARIACLDVDLEAAQSTANRIRESGADAMALHADVSVDADCRRTLAQVEATWGPVGVLFNNAGVYKGGPLHEMEEGVWDLQMNVNLKGAFLMSRAALPGMMTLDSGAIVNNASTYALYAALGSSAYGASKAGLLGLTRQMALEYGPKIRVNSVSPGMTGTPAALAIAAAADDPAAMEAELVAVNHVMRRWCTPREVATTVLFLASNDASFVTGHDLMVTGGQTITA